MLTKETLYMSILISTILTIVLVVLFLIRESKIRERSKKLERDLKKRLSEMGSQQQEIDKQKKELHDQIIISDQQNELIHQQTIELDKHRHSLEKTVELRTRELNIAKEEAEASSRLKTSFLENISHEIRTPMNAIIGFSSLLTLPDASNQDRVMYSQRIQNNCDTLLLLIDNIIDMSKMQAGQMVLVKRKFSVNEILTSLLDGILEEKKALEKEELQISVKLPSDKMEYTLFTDPSRFKQVMKSLLSNALKYTEKGEIRFGFEPLFNSEYDKEPSLLQFFVEDTGIGILEENASFIFESFNKIEEDNTKFYRGAGLGLFISKGMVELMGGKIWFNSKVNEGSTFYFTIPYMEIAEVAAKRKRKEKLPQKESISEYDWRNKTILIAEDEQNNIIYLSEILRRTGATILEVKNGKKAVELVEKNMDISLILMDLMMPEMDGYEATQRIKTMRPKLPIIAQTAYAKAREKEKSLEVGCDGYISKPYNPPELLRLLQTFMVD